MNLTKKRFLTDLYFLGVVMVLVTIPYPIKLNHLFQWIASFLWFFAFIGDKDLRSQMVQALRQNKIALGFILMAIVISFSVLVHLDTEQSFSPILKTIEKRTPFLLFPFILSGVVFLSQKQRNQLINLFVGNMAFALLLCLVVGTTISIATGTIEHQGLYSRENNFLYHRLGSYIGMHGVFLASYVVFAYCIALTKLINGFRSMERDKKAFYLLLLLFFVVGVFLLFSITIAITLPILSIFIVWYYWKKSGNSLHSKHIFAVIVIFTMLSAGGYLALVKLDLSGNVLEYRFQDRAGADGSKWNAINIRLALWKVGLDAATDHWLVGVGPGNMKSILNGYYEEYEFHFAQRVKFNPHNQFIHSFLTLGIFGIATLLLILFFSIRESFRTGNVIWMCLILLFILFSISASTLSVNKGIVFFTFFFVLLSYLRTDINLNKSN